MQLHIISTCPHLKIRHPPKESMAWLHYKDVSLCEYQEKRMNQKYVKSGIRWKKHLRSETPQLLIYGNSLTLKIMTEGFFFFVCFCFCFLFLPFLKKIQHGLLPKKGEGSWRGPSITFVMQTYLVFSPVHLL